MSNEKLYEPYDPSGIDPSIEFVFMPKWYELLAAILKKHQFIDNNSDSGRIKKEDGRVC